MLLRDLISGGSSFQISGPLQETACWVTVNLWYGGTARCLLRVLIEWEHWNLLWFLYIYIAKLSLYKSSNFNILNLENKGVDDASYGAPAINRTIFVCLTIIPFKCASYVPPQINTQYDKYGYTKQ